MPVPDARVEFQIGGTWTDATDHAIESAGIQLEYGRSDEGRPVDPGSGSLTLLSPGGLYSNRNPNSPYYGLLPRNTPVRVSTAGATPYLLVPEGVTGRASTPDHASLDITGDLDIRVEVDPQMWVGGGGGYELIGKYQIPGNQRSWRLIITGEGQLFLTWSTDGTAIPSGYRSPILSLHRRQAVRATLDVNNGVGGYTITYYTAQTLAGPWTQLGQAVGTTGTTSIYASTAPLEVGDISNLALSQIERRIYKAEVRNGIDGPIVAAPDFTAQTPGTTSFADSAGRTWTLANGSSISDRAVLAVQSVPTWPTTWHRSGHDVRAPIQTAGVLRRLGQGKKQLASTLRRRIPSYGPVAYWPCEDGSGATQAASALEGAAALRFTKAQFGADDSLAGSTALPSVDSGGTMTGAVPTVGAPTTEWSVHFFYRLDSAPAANAEIMSWRTTGSLKRWRVLLGPATGTIQAFDSDGVLQIDHAVALTSAYFSGWWRLTIRVIQSGGTITWHLNWRNVGGPGAGYSTTAPGTAGAVSQVNTALGTFSGLRIGHITVLPTSDEAVTNAAFLGADTGWAGESAVSRIQRLAAEEAQTLTLSAWQGDMSRVSEPMGPQRPGALLDVLQEPADSDGGVLIEDTQRLALVYRDRTSLENQPAVSIPYSALTTPFAPEEGDVRLRNDITVQRIGGSSARAVQETGPLSTTEVGVYDEAVPLSLYQDEQAAQIAWWRLHMGTWDEARYPSVRIMLHKHPELIPALSALQIGDRVQITGTPSWMPPGPVDLLVQRIRHDVRTHTWDMVLACSPAGPWRVGVLDDQVLGRVDTDGTTLGAAVTASDTSLLLVSGPGAPWITNESHPADFPVDLQVGGEVVRATAIRGVVADAFGRTVASGWGNADSGQAWTRAGGLAADFSVGGGVGAHAGARGTLRATTVPVTLADIDIRADVSMSAVPAGGTAEIHLMARRLGSGDFYTARLMIAAGGAVTLSLRKFVASVETQLATYTTGLTLGAGTWYTLRLSVQGSALAAKVWPRTGAEPAPWQVSATDTSLTLPGVVGLRTLLGSTTTNPLPVPFSFDNIISTPQQATVVRSVNGIVKSHSAGAAVSLAQPVYLAL
ncbi:hypothetical protein ACFQ67_00105 [Streptomyces sp. NPDC056488]|uniref:hypothetical protein n=1 Tax=Streptomyces sp. NPDC056488 TaxID=3345836 RepID=UPI00367CE681